MSYSWGASCEPARVVSRPRTHEPVWTSVGAAIREAAVHEAAVHEAAVQEATAVHEAGGDVAGPRDGELAAELAPMVEVWRRLLVQHVPDRAGRCLTCTEGGTGLPSVPWPCSIRGVAELARRRHDADLR